MPDPPPPPQRKLDDRQSPLVSPAELGRDSSGGGGGAAAGLPHLKREISGAFGKDGDGANVALSLCGKARPRPRPATYSRLYWRHNNCKTI